MRPAKLLLAYGSLMLAWAVPAWPATDQATFAVQIQLNGGSYPVLDSDGYCVNEVLSEQTNAIVTVVCNTNQFVSIRAQPGKPFLGTHGGAYLYSFGKDRQQTRRFLNDDNAAWLSGYGSSTSMRIFFTDDMRELREMLVTF